MRILHLAERADWDRAVAGGGYRTSTRGQSLDDAGFLHACTTAQLAGVLERYYADADLGRHVVLVVDVDLCAAAGSPVRWDPVGPAGERFPHVYGPLPVPAVVAALPVTRAPDGRAVVPDVAGLDVAGAPPE
ncbi:DUF952 domain-containing protein [Nakamurella endophytica]|uniref:DUF952 domain-containing protein n=1 Tax=Nakamurella endophytica TaxID=1748367 RepID=A0A917WGX0_9ACTN|nr:DUF952 domain-containing protein [Nakamurella endophytica]GGM04131.1 hypothetical protein GCM10011594_25430 [Nakamurella endophytica]